MRLIELEDGWATAIELDNSVVGWGLSLAGLGMMAGMGALVRTENPLGMGVAGLGIVAMFAFPQRSYTRFRLRPHGLDVGTLYLRGAPSIDQVRAGEVGSMSVPRREGTRELPFSDMPALGHTDYSV